MSGSNSEESRQGLSGARRRVKWIERRCLVYNWRRPCLQSPPCLSQSQFHCLFSGFFSLRSSVVFLLRAEMRSAKHQVKCAVVDSEDEPTHQWRAASSVPLLNSKKGFKVSGLLCRLTFPVWDGLTVHFITPPTAFQMGWTRSGVCTCAFVTEDIWCCVCSYRGTGSFAAVWQTLRRFLVFVCLCDAVMLPGNMLFVCLSEGRSQ